PDPEPTTPDPDPTLTVDPPAGNQNGGNNGDPISFGSDTSGSDTFGVDAFGLGTSGPDDAASAPVSLAGAAL
ncbi:hypothetical protein G6045_37075, partial [Streptomyces sp. YC504]